MNGSAAANVLVVEHRDRQLQMISEKVELVGHAVHPIRSIEEVVGVARKTNAEVALLHLNFTENGGGIVAGYFLREVTKTTRILAYTGDCAGTGLEVARSLGLADRVVTIDGLLENFDQILPPLVGGARADRAAAAALEEAGRPHALRHRPPKVAVHSIDLGALHDVLDRTIIIQLLDWLGTARCVARALRIPPQSLRWKMEKLGIDSKNRDFPSRR